MRGLGLAFNASLLTDRETDKSYAVHAGECEHAFDAALESAGVDKLSRFAPMGPTRLDDGEPCDWGQCKGGE